jgi:AcrR family transcriptional regulator
MSVLKKDNAKPRVVRRKRRSYKSAEERRQQILACALEAFAARGYHATSIADVCQRAGIGRATLYQYFNDKRDLLVALADGIATRVTDAFERRQPMNLRPGFRPTEEQAVAFIQQRFLEFAKVVFEDAATVRLVLRAGRGADGVVDDILRRIDEAVLETVVEELRAAKQAGVIRDLDERFAARFILGGVEKTVLTYLDEDRPIDLEAIAREAALLEVCGIFPR